MSFIKNKKFLKTFILLPTIFLLICTSPKQQSDEIILAKIGKKPVHKVYYNGANNEAIHDALWAMEIYLSDNVNDSLNFRITKISFTKPEIDSNAPYFHC